MPTYTLEGPKWTTPVVTWSFVNLANSGTSQFSSAIGAQYQALVQRAVQQWDDTVNLTFQQVTDSASTDIRIGFSRFGLGGQIGEADYTYTVPGSTQVFQPSVTVRIEDPAQRPLAPENGTLVYQNTQTSLYQVILHELGHALGLGHDTDPTATMYPTSTVQNRDLSASDLAGIHTLYAAPSFAQTDTTTGVASRPDGEAYAGPVSYLSRQYIYGGTDNIAVAASDPNVFIKGGSGDDAISVTAGQNVLDGGTGSNFLTGGTGIDTFFVDGRGGQVTWGTLVNFHAGDAATLWGFDPALSTRTWAPTAEGAAGYTGLTLHASLDGSGTTNASITFAGLTDPTHLILTTGSVGGQSYLYITNPT